MFYLNDSNFIQSSMLGDIPHLIHAFSTRKAGDMRKKANRDGLIDALMLKGKHLICLKQTHGKNILVINKNNIMQNNLRQFDAVIYKKKDIINRQYPLLSVQTADCVPILLVDDNTKTVSAVHAGWKGTALNITKKVVAKMVEFGSRPYDIQAVLGPYIKSRCYEVNQYRFKKFTGYQHDSKSVYEKRGKYYLDLGRINRHQLLEMGLTARNIDLSPYCTFCDNKKFFSYRARNRLIYGNNLNLIGYLN